ncbi:hypothetical protein SYNPS1DRAFT_27988 [Syncephalis pseudoplumigaleata]|uniref:Rad60/SUMO-like domain-containing protein n=1 Tax=Syncephalis pseudoplumigaleata TaxID=1712513 RepID=A0A4P9Z1T7_9FUNG|nr:hypothetical protein SYNPS1DRAFT_27988 [Syncephalis pseudoplumigaleata]|eukprot:RKP26315.1 hypothetical protein SYNPS1DRAFT_27988 [Syncephalis pseudoplumigaleata]
MSDTDSSSSEVEQRPRPRIKPQKLSVPVAHTAARVPMTDEDGQQVDSFFRRANTHYLASNVSVLSSDESDDDSTAATTEKPSDAGYDAHDGAQSDAHPEASTERILLSEDDDEDDDDDERERSLTPPPEFAITRSIRHSTETGNDNDDTYNCDLVEEENEADAATLIDLDPELQKIASHTPEQVDIADVQPIASPHEGVKIDMLVKTIRHPQLPVTTENALQLAELERPLLFSMRNTAPFEMLLDAYCQCKGLAKNNVVLAYKSVRLYPHGTPHSLGITSNVEIEAFTADAFQYISVERELSRKRKLAELVTSGPADEALLLNSQSSEASSESTTWIHLKIRDKAGHDEKLRVRPTTLVGAIISEYKRIRQLPEGASIRLELEGEQLDPQDKVADTDVEDDDMLTAVVL